MPPASNENSRSLNRSSLNAVRRIWTYSWADFDRFKGEVQPAADAVVLFDGADPVARAREDLGLGASAHWLSVPFAKLAGDAGAKGSKNVVGLGVLTALFGLRQETIRRAIEKRFGRKKAAVGELALKAFDAGLAHGATLATLKDRGLTFTPGRGETSGTVSAIDPRPFSRSAFRVPRRKPWR